jgi:hypothetical protein
MQKMTDVSEVLTASNFRMTISLKRGMFFHVVCAIITLTMEALNTCETSVNFYQTTRRNMH